MNWNLLKMYPLLLLLLGCKSLTKRCEPAPDEFFPTLNSKYIDLISGLQNKTEVFKNSSNQVDTIKFSSLKYDNIVSPGSNCNEPHQTCCNKLHYEIYSIPFSSKISIPPNFSYDIGINSMSPTGGLTSSYIWGLTSIDTVITVDYNHNIITDAYLNISKSTNDTLGLISKSKGILIFTDNQNRKWNRIL